MIELAFSPSTWSEFASKSIRLISTVYFSMLVSGQGCASAVCPETSASDGLHEDSSQCYLAHHLHHPMQPNVALVALLHGFTVVDVTCVLKPKNNCCFWLWLFARPAVGCLERACEACWHFLIGSHRKRPFCMYLQTASVPVTIRFQK